MGPKLPYFSHHNGPVECVLRAASNTRTRVHSTSMVPIAALIRSQMSNLYSHIYYFLASSAYYTEDSDPRTAQYHSDTMQQKSFMRKYNTNSILLLDFNALYSSYRRLIEDFRIYIRPSAEPERRDSLAIIWYPKDAWHQSSQTLLNLTGPLSLLQSHVVWMDVNHERLSIIEEMFVKLLPSLC